MIVRLLLFIAIFAIGWWLYRQIKQQFSSNVKKDKQPDSEKMVRCSHCQTHLPASHAVFDEHQVPFCSQDHRLKGPKS